MNTKTKTLLDKYCKNDSEYSKNLFKILNTNYVEKRVMKVTLEELLQELKDNYQTLKSLMEVEVA